MQDRHNRYRLALCLPVIALLVGCGDGEDPDPDVSDTAITDTAPADTGGDVAVDVDADDTTTDSDEPDTADATDATDVVEDTDASDTSTDTAPEDSDDGDADTVQDTFDDADETDDAVDSTPDADTEPDGSGDTGSDVEDTFDDADGSGEPEELCGDGFADGFIGEQCDDANREDGDGCSSECTIEVDAICATTATGLSVCQRPECGNDNVEFGEECDDGATAAEDGCAAGCVVEPGWACDGSPSTCEESDCGDGTRQIGESCDDGDGDDGDGCSGTCSVELPLVPGSAVLFDGALVSGAPLFTRPTYACGAQAPGSYLYRTFRVKNHFEFTMSVDISARFDARAGLFVHHASFDPSDPSDTCLDVSNSHPTLGSRGAELLDVSVPPGVERVIVVAADTQRLDMGDFEVTITTRGCGDGIIRGSEDCDDGNTGDGDGCSSTCTVEDDYTCEDSPSYCYTNGCGGGAVDGAEECDDGNLVDDDGCSSTCAVDPGWSCVGDRPSVCTRSICGDGEISPLEGCDDGNTDNDDGCDDDCEIEDGWVCENEPSECAASFCGDGFIDDDTEFCDDGNSIDGDGCSSGCLVELATIGGSLDASGAITNTASIYARATAACTAPGSTTLSYFWTRGYVNNTGGAVSLQVEAEIAGDAVLHLYSTFNGSNATENCLVGLSLAGGTPGSVATTVDDGATVHVVLSGQSQFVAPGAFSMTLQSLAP